MNTMLRLFDEDRRFKIAGLNFETKNDQEADQAFMRRNCLLIFGSRKSGKNTLAKGLLRAMKESESGIMDLENPTSL
jgi:type II secretory ATPase GspE/PulE/Tfp pilus assembly ATPase PilB-like protein